MHLPAAVDHTNVLRLVVSSLRFDLDESMRAWSNLHATKVSAYASAEARRWTGVEQSFCYIHLVVHMLDSHIARSVAS